MVSTSTAYCNIKLTLHFPHTVHLRVSSDCHNKQSLYKEYKRIGLCTGVGEPYCGGETKIANTL
jgi:hypothetical protein